MSAVVCRRGQASAAAVVRRRGQTSAAAVVCRRGQTSAAAVVCRRGQTSAAAVGIGMVAGVLFTTLALAQQAETKPAADTPVGKILVERLHVQPEKVTTTANLKGDLGADELELVELLAIFEEKFACEIPDSTVGGMQTVSDAVRIVEECAKSPRKTP